MLVVVVAVAAHHQLQPPVLAVQAVAEQGALIKLLVQMQLLILVVAVERLVTATKWLMWHLVQVALAL